SCTLTTFLVGKPIHCLLFSLIQQALSRKTENYRKYARHSTFYIGLWGESWVDSMFSNWQVVVELMSLSPHKLPNYQQGIRAMRLILSAL
ncbi:hypothetical protein QT989_25220, partial [Microcoleus sp. SVA1_B6]